MRDFALTTLKSRMKNKAKAEQRSSVFARSLGKCVYCGKELSLNKGGFTIDHIVPKSLAKNIPYNLVAACGACNQLKGDSIDQHWIEKGSLAIQRAFS